MACARVQRREARRRREERVGDAFVLFRLARAGGVDQPAARRDALARRAAACVSSRRGERRQILLAPAPADVGIAAQRAEARARRVDEHAVENGARRAAAASRSACTRRTLAAPLAATVRRSSSMRPVADVAGDEQAAAVHAARRAPSSCRRATRRCRAPRAAGGRRPAAPRAATLRPARRTSLAPGRLRERVALVDDQAIGRERGRVHPDLVVGRLVGTSRARERSPANVR